VHTEINRDSSNAAGQRALWFGLFAGPAAFLLNLQISYMLAPQSCRAGSTVALHVTNVACLALAVAGGLIAWRSWRRTGREWPGDEGGVISRSRFMAALGVMTSALCALVVVAQWIPTLFLSPCQ
jgi:hypothetical protein